MGLRKNSKYSSIYVAYIIILINHSFMLTKYESLEALLGKIIRQWHDGGGVE